MRNMKAELRFLPHIPLFVHRHHKKRIAACHIIKMSRLFYGLCSSNSYLNFPHVFTEYCAIKHRIKLQVWYLIQYRDKYHNFTPIILLA